jgi:amino acid permease
MSVALVSKKSNAFEIDPEDLVSTSLQEGRTSSVNEAGQRSSSRSRMFSSQEDESSGLGGSSGSFSSGRRGDYVSVGNGAADEMEMNQDSGGVDSSAGQAPPAHMYGSWVGYCFTVNYILGVGVLGMPFAFYKGGWLLSTFCLGLVTVMATFTALWLVDVSLRAQYIKRQERLRVAGELDHNDGGHLGPSDLGVIQQKVSTRSQHRYEMNELVEMFLGLRARRFYEVLVIIYLVGALWSYTSVFASSLASHVGLPNINGGNECDIYKDSSSSCSDLYYTYVAMFTLVAVPLTCLDLTEMKILQIGLAIFRFVSLATMMITSMVAIYRYPSPEPGAHSPSSSPYVSGDFKAFDWANLGLVFPVAVYSQIFHHSVPGLSHPLKDKRQTPRVFTGVLITTMVLYTLLGISVAAYYGSSIPQTCTLAWAEYTGGQLQQRRPC